MPPDISVFAERAASLEARVEELTRAFHDHVEREEMHQLALLNEMVQLRQFLHTARTIGRITIWGGGVIFAMISGLPPLIQWLHEHIALKP
jgi:hypothetical protein